MQIFREFLIRPVLAGTHVTAQLFKLVIECRLAIAGT
jgi:hypothetical protein